VNSASLAARRDSRLWFLGLPVVAALAFGLLVFFPIAWGLVLVLMVLISIAGLRTPSVEAYHAYGRLAWLGAAWTSAVVVYITLALLQ
jgi:hypothetical protein